MSKLAIAIIYGSTRENRYGIRLSYLISNLLNKRGNDTTIVDPMDYNLPTLNKRYADYKNGSAPKNLEKLHNILDASDSFVLVSGEYNHFPPPALINLLDHFSPEYYRKPSAVCTYSTGDFAGIRVQTPLRAFLAQLGTPPIRESFHQPNINKSLLENGEPTSEKNIHIRFNLFAEEIEWYSKVLREGRKKEL